ncbi:MAG: hypothetical protein ACYDIB_01480 [Desulfobulbia bacterium]
MAQVKYLQKTAADILKDRGRLVNLNRLSPLPALIAAGILFY